jgi:RNA polymerase sigma-70 factor (ECF subfamily)
MVTATPFGRPDSPAVTLRPIAVSPVSPDGAPEASQDVLTLAKAGDQAAFAALVRRHQNMVFSVALHMLRSRPAAEDLAQEVFLELYRSLDRLESDAHVTSWLRRVASHRCIDEIRRRNHRPEFGTDVVPEEGHSPRMRDIFVTDRLQALLGGLPAKARMVVVLRYQEDMDPTEIADALGMPINTVKSHLRRSIAALRDRLLGRGQS